MKDNVIEAEIINEPEGFSYKERYETYSTQTKQVSSFAWIVSIASLFFSLIPVFGFIFALVAFIIAIIKKIPPVLPVIALIISGFVTSIFLLIVMLIRAIF